MVSRFNGSFSLIEATSSKKRVGETLTQPTLKQLCQTLQSRVGTTLQPRVGTTLGSTYSIPLSSLRPGELENIKKDLTLQICDITNHIVHLTAFCETKDSLFVPRYYGLDRFSNPQTVDLTIGATMSPEVKCTMVLRENRRQPEAISLVKAALAKKFQWGGFLCLPCGWGKTGCALKIATDVIKELEGAPRRTLVIVPNTTIRDQWLSRISKFLTGVKVGILQQKIVQIQGYDIVVAMVHSLAKHSYPDLDTFGCMILDEAHHMTAPHFSKALQRVNAKYILALSATPERASPAETKWLHYYMGPVIFKPERPPDENLLVRMLWYKQTPGRSITTKGLKPRPLHHIMYEKMVADKLRTSILASIVVEYYRNPQRNVLVIAKRLQLLHDIADLLRKDGVPEKDIGLLIGKIEGEERAQQQTRRIVLAIEQLGKEGLDATHLNTLVLAMPIGKMKQPTGRIQRTAEDDEESTGVYTSPIVVYFVDPYGIYEHMAWKHVKEFKVSGYTVRHEDLTDYKVDLGVPSLF